MKWRNCAHLSKEFPCPLSYTKDRQKKIFDEVHSKEVGQFFKQWGDWVAEKGKLVYLFCQSFNLTLLILRVGSLRWNEKDEEEDEEVSTETKDEVWKKFLDVDNNWVLLGHNPYCTDEEFK